jgi:hypothetical protein
MDTNSLFWALVQAHKALVGRPGHNNYAIYLDLLEDATVLLGVPGAADLDLVAQVQADLEDATY